MANYLAIFIAICLFCCALSEERKIEAKTRELDVVIKRLWKKFQENGTLSRDEEEFLNELMQHGWQEHHMSRALAPEVHMDVKELITSKGYPVEEHFVTTSDGYILGLHRIRHGKNNNNNQAKEVVFVQHGLFGSDADWLCNTPDKNLPFLLADAGYDVWLGNSRGNRYAKGHVSLKTTSRDYWKFSFDHMAQYDLPASISYVLDNVTQSQLNYIGYSQGSLMAFTGFSQNKTLGKMIKKFYALAPVYTITQATSPLKIIAPYFGGVDFLFWLNPLSSGELFGDGVVLKFMAKYACAHSVSAYICGNLLFLLVGENEKNLDKTRLPIYFSHTPAGTSLQDLSHFAQIYNAKACQKYDYGKSTNQKMYGQDTPPTYDVKEMSADIPVMLYSGGNDLLASPGDVRKLQPQLKGFKSHTYIHEYQHLDFMWGRDVDEKIYRPIIDDLKNNK